MKKILGLDLGVASIGWGLVETDEKTTGQIIGTGVRIFQSNQQRAESAPGESSNADRRTKRSVRRQRDRRTRRKKKLYNHLKRNELAPEKKGWDQWVSINPYEIRAKALDKNVSLEEFGRALYHINQRRGYKSNRKAGSDKEGAVSEGISKVREHMDNYNARTIGEYCFKIYDNHLENDVEHDDFDWRIRDKYTHRSMFEEEFDLLWDNQAKFHNGELSEKLRDETKEIIFHQRELKVQSHLIGNCPLESDKKRIAKAHLLFQEFRIIKNLNNLTISDENGLSIPLTVEDKRAIKEVLDKKDKATFNSLKNVLKKRGTIDNNNALFNLERGDRKYLEGNRTNHALSREKAFGDDWFDLDEEFKNHVVDVLIHVDKPEVVKNLALDKWDRTNEQAEYLSDLTLEKGYAGYSEKAIKQLLPHLKEGLEESTAIDKAGYTLFKQKTGTKKQLPMPPEIKNPVVYHALIELRKVVNGIIRKYGMPDVIRVELARDLKAGYEHRQKMNKRMRDLEKKNDKARNALQKAPFNVQYPGYNDIIWYNLWEECDKRCPYTGKSIPAEAFNSGEFQIEHIIPFSRSLDNSYANKTLCEADFNRKKGNRTPWECVEAGLLNEGKLLQQIRKIPWRKRNKFTQKEVDEDKFLNRQLNDTRYISREASSFLKHLACESVEVVKGQTTSLLRHLWGLNTILTLEDDEMKNREDHRHHAIDAMVVALTSRGTLKRLSDENKVISMPSWQDEEESSKDRYDEMKNRLSGRIRLKDPWEDFRNHVEYAVNGIVVSHKVNRKISGALHEETYYGPTEEEAPKNKEMMVVRKPVHQLSKKDLKEIRDDRVRQIVNNEVIKRMEAGNSLDIAIKSLESEPPYIISSKAEIPIKKVRLLRKQDPSIMHHFDNENGEVYRSAVYGNNHHIAIYEINDNNGRKELIEEVITMMEAARRVLDGEPVVMRNHPEYNEFIFSLSQNEIVKNLDDDKLYRVQIIESDKRLTLREISVAPANASHGKIRKRPKNLNLRKVTVDPIGRVLDAND